MTLPKQATHYFNQNVSEFFLSDDPLFTMLNWLLHEFMRAESETLVGAENN